MTRRLLLLLCVLTMLKSASAQQSAGPGGQRSRQDAPVPVVLKPARVWDGLALEAHDGWLVVVRGDKIEAAGPASEIGVPADARVIELPGNDAACPG